MCVSALHFGKMCCKVEGFPDIHHPRGTAAASRSAGVGDKSEMVMLTSITERVALLEKNEDEHEKETRRMLH
ncbi:hypothetical protein JVT61DRAFT_3681 [Boletus reticuloceps]|uniref:Uncharacterized protein n=1 Tax=Boletus reticuloceps TaxID=495285 RepID=A0A8I2YQ62_9AGAM|nr:hypothetical protein JVT61DRAFT_3681 [Boletus reticuloceps]